MIHCRVCGEDFEDKKRACPKCGVDTSILTEKVHLPPARGPVNDYPDVLTEDQQDKLTEITDAFFRETEIPIVITVVHTTEPLEPPEYAFLLYNHWGIGQVGVNRGFLILLCLKERHVESEVGYGLEDVLPEEIGDKIVQEEFMPYFREDKYYEGLKAGTVAVMNALREKLA